jgi:hypothetical protein
LQLSEVLVAFGSSWAQLWTVPSEHFELHAVALVPKLAAVLVAEENVGRDPERPELGKYCSILALRNERTGDLIIENDGVRPFDELQQFAVGATEPVVALGYERALHVYQLKELDRDSEPRVIQTEWTNLRGMAFHPSARFLLTVADGPSVSVWDTKNWKMVQEYAWEIGKLRAVGVSKDGLLAAVGSNRGTVAVWDWEL